LIAQIARRGDELAVFSDLRRRESRDVRFIRREVIRKRNFVVSGPRRGSAETKQEQQTPVPK
jgi:hypothetical protein